MDLIKLAIVFATILVLIHKKLSLSVAVTVAGAEICLLYQLSLNSIGHTLLNGILGWGTIQLLLVLYLITFLQRMLECRHCLSNAKEALDGLFNSRRMDASLAPTLLGMLPAVGTVLICGDIVRDSSDGYLSPEEQACVTSYYRHVSELFFPTYTSILIAINLSEGRVSVGAFTLAMLPMMAALMAIGWLIYLRKLPKDAGFTPSHGKGWYAGLLIRSLWTIVFTVVLIVVFNVPVYLAVLMCILLNIVVERFSFSELLPFFKSAFERRLIISTLVIMIFKELLSATGVISQFPHYFDMLPIPAFLVFAIIFFFGSVVSGSQAIIILCMPMAMATVGTASALPLFILLMCMTYAAMQISPIHVCLAVCAEDYHVSLGTLVWKTLPLVALFCGASFVYYAILLLLHI